MRFRVLGLNSSKRVISGLGLGSKLLKRGYVGSKVESFGSKLL